jgi:hypothetical protein
MKIDASSSTKTKRDLIPILFGFLYSAIFVFFGLGVNHWFSGESTLGLIAIVALLPMFILFPILNLLPDNIMFYGFLGVTFYFTLGFLIGRIIKK